MAPRSVIAKKVKDYLLKSAAIEDFWRRPITRDQLQLEINRMTAQTKDPQMLSELFAALNNDPTRIAECLARPILADRLLRNWFAADERIHESLKQRVAETRKKITAQNFLSWPEGQFQELHFKWKTREGEQEPGIVLLTKDEFDKQSGSGRPGEVNMLETDTSFVLRMIVTTKPGDRVVALRVFPKTTFEEWATTQGFRTSEPSFVSRAEYRLPSLESMSIPQSPDSWAFQISPLGRQGHTAVWTGSEMIIWGGFFIGSLASGARYSPTLDSWTATNMSSSAAPVARSGHSAVWTGSEMIVWGGSGPGILFNTGGRYNPVLDQWTATNSVAPGLPAARSVHTAVWTGNSMIVWGGRDVNGNHLNTGGIYRPGLDTWTSTDTGDPDLPCARYGHTAIWTGDQMIVWGGFCSSGLTKTGGSYSPGLNTWTTTDTADPDTPVYRAWHSAVWTGSEMIVWGGYGGTPSNLNTGGRYNPVLNAWSMVDTSGPDTPAARYHHTAIWTGNEMIVWGGVVCQPGGGCGADGTEVSLNSGSRYDASSNTWIAMASTGAPGSRGNHTAVWTGSEMIVWGGANYLAGSTSTTLGTGGRYNPDLNSWIPIPDSTGPTGRQSQSAIWTGSEMIIWGGSSWSYLNSGSRYTPATDNWVATDTVDPDTPSARGYHTATWTGTEMVVWGGTDGSNYFNTGSRYNPGSDDWTPMNNSSPSVPGGRILHTAVWTGTQVIIWGGMNLSGNFNSGGRYNPSNDTWLTTNIADPDRPSARSYHTAAWTGTEMLIRGGGFGGGRYDPDGDLWSSMSMNNAPSFYGNQAIWTGSEMIVWGGYDGGGFVNTGRKYSPANDEWTDLNSTDPDIPSARRDYVAVWTGTEMILWGGQESDDTPLTDGGRYDRANDTWNPLIGTEPLISMTTPTAVWTGAEMILWGANPAIELAIFYPNTPPQAVAKLNPSVAVYDSVHKAPLCVGPTDACDSGGATLSRDNIAGLGEPNQPNTINNSCADGTAGTYTGFESLENIRVSSLNGGALMAGDTAVVEVAVWAKDSSDRLDIFYAADANSPVWTLLTTVAPPAVLGPWGFSTTYSLPSGSLQALRAQFRHGGSPIPCMGGSLNDRDDLIFAVGPYVLGTGASLNLQGGYSTDGSNPSNGFHDKFDSIVSYEWDVNNDAGLPATCDTAGAGFDLLGVTPSPLDDSALDALGIATIGNHTIWLRVTDEVGAHSCASVLLNVQDGVAPTASVIVPNGGESWAYSADTLNRQKHLIVWTSSDNFGLSRTRVSYTTDGTNYTCIADSNGTCPAGVLSAAATSYLWQMPTQGEAAGSSPAQTFPTTKAKIKVEVWDTSNNMTPDTSDSNFYIVQPTTTSIKTLILWDSVRICNQYDGTNPACTCSNWANDTDCTQTRNLSLSLQQLMDHSKVAGVRLDLVSVPAVQTAYGNWDVNNPATPANPALANAVANEIRNYIMSQVDNTYTNAQYLILVGDDAQIPFYRMTDGATFYTESNYPGEVGLNTTTTVGSALAAGYFFTDNYYSERQPEDSGMIPPHDKIYLNDLYIGRLVETPAQMRTVIDAFLENNGQLNAVADTDKVLVMGHDFLYDSAFDIKENYKSSLIPNGLTRTECLLDDIDANGTTDPCVDKPFSAADLEAELFEKQAVGPDPLHRILNINTHANHFSFDTKSIGGLGNTLYCTVPSYSPTKCYQASGMETNANNLRAGVLYTSGCHSGLTVPSTDSRPVDLPEEMAKKRVVAFIGNTGYGWGLKYGKGLTEGLMLLLTEKIVQTGSIPIGKALADAKRRYHILEKRYDVFDEKVEHELTLFGIPNYLIVTDSAFVGLAPTAKQEMLPGPEGPDQACANGICLEKKLTRQGRVPPLKRPRIHGLRTTPEALAPLPPGITELDLNFSFGPGTYQLVNTTPAYPCSDVGIEQQGCYYKLNGQSSGDSGHTVQPHFAYDSALSGTKAHGVILTGGAYLQEAPFNPVVAVPLSTNTDLGEGQIPGSRAFVPDVTTSTETSSSGSGTSTTTFTNMVVHTGDFDDSTDTEIRFDDMQFVVYYSNSSDTTKPAVTDPGSGGFHTLSGLTASFQATVSDASGIFRVLITYDDTRTGSLKSFDLTCTSTCTSTSQTWEGSLNLKGDISYYIQVIDKNGNVGTLTESGFDLSGSGTQYGSTWSGPKTFKIMLADTDADTLPDAYEQQYQSCLNMNVADAGSDPDNDYLTNANEFGFDTNPCKGDTDGGGDNDGSEKNNNRNPLNAGDDKLLTIMVTNNSGIYTISWPNGTGNNSSIDGYYFVYRSDTPFFDPTDKINATPLADGTTSYPDNSGPTCSPCYYNVWNYQVDTQPPSVASVVPNTGTSAGGTLVRVFGENFQSGAKVYFDGVLAENITFVSSNLIQCNTPGPHAAVPVEVKVKNPNGQEGALANGFAYQ